MSIFRTEYWRNLPHFQQPGEILFCTYRLHGSLPKEVLRALAKQRRSYLNSINAETVTDHDRIVATHRMRTKLFKKWDAALDRQDFGPTWLARPKIAEIVRKCIDHRHPEFYRLICYSIMPNHVHQVQLHYRKDLAFYGIIGRLKQYAARQANQALDRTGNPFWQDESFDHVVRSGRLKSTIAYVLNNPVEAGLASTWLDWPFNWLSPDFDEPRSRCKDTF